MPRVKVRTESQKQRIRVEDVAQKTEILKKEFELEFGKWNFVVLGPSKKGNIVIREGFATHLTIQTSRLYSAAVGDPDIIGSGGIPIEEFIEEDTPEELFGLDIYSIDPVRPLTITKKTEATASALQKTVDAFIEGRAAVIMCPDEKYWVISVLKYLNECDQAFPDHFIQSIKNGDLPLRAQIEMPYSFDSRNSRLLN